MRRLQQVCLANLARLSKDFKQSPAIRGLRRAILPCAACVAVWRILAVLWKHDNLSHRELSELTSIEVSSLSRISKTVQRDGLIRRKRTVQDQRTVRVTLTDKGREVVKQVIPWALSCQEDIIGGLPPRQVRDADRDILREFPVGELSVVPQRRQDAPHRNADPCASCALANVSSCE